MAVNELTDPLQGYDVKVSVSTILGKGNNQLVGAFTSLMFKIVNQTETYLPVNSRIPRHLDGEILVVWSMEQGLVNLNVIKNTFGNDFEAKFKLGRGTLIPRSARFDIVWTPNLADKDKDTLGSPAEGEATLQIAESHKKTFRLHYCRVDTFSFGVTAGRHIVANAWQGTAQHISSGDVA